MKFLVTLVVVIALILIAVYYIGFEGWDPAKQGRDARAAIGPGMTWTQVFAITGDPKIYRPIQKKSEQTSGGIIELFQPGPQNPFDRQRLTARLAENSLPHGFICRFGYTNAVAFKVRFDGTGTVVSVQDAATMATLLQLDDE